MLQSTSPIMFVLLAINEKMKNESSITCFYLPKKYENLHLHSNYKYIFKRNLKSKCKKVRYHTKYETLRAKIQHCSHFYENDIVYILLLERNIRELLSYKSQKFFTLISNRRSKISFYKHLFIQHLSYCFN